MKRLILFLAVACIACSQIYAQVGKKEYSPFEKALQGISSNEMMSYVEWLASPQNKGRLAGSPEYARCAQWAANLFATWGLTPGGDNGFYFQNFPIHYTDVKGAGTLRVISDEMDVKYEIHKDYYVGTHTAGGALKEDVVYVGYGITAPDLGYDDYSGVDVKGKIVIIEPGTPCSNDHPLYNKFDSLYAGTHAKMDNAVKHGVAGVLFGGKFSHPGIHIYDGLIYCHIGDKVINDMLQGSDKSAFKLREGIKKAVAPSSFLIEGVKVEMIFESQQVKNSLTQNVIGYIPGSDNKLMDSPIVVGAHLDHLGSPGIIMPGAMDNASGSAILLSVAKAFAESGIKPVRPIVFILFGAEEHGMLGSKYYVKHPLFPLDKTLCMFNMDMVGNGTEIRIACLESFPNMRKVVDEANDQYTRRIIKVTPHEWASGKMYTDGEIFNNSRVITFFYGPTNRVGKVYYHVPEDLPDTFTPEIMEDLGKLLFVTLSRVSVDKNFKL